MNSLHRLLLPAALFATSLVSAQTGAGLPEAAPGVPLPSTGTIFVVDQVHEAPALRQLHPSEIHYNSHAAGNFARSAVYAGPHSSTEIVGISSAVTLHTNHAVLYVRLSGDDPEVMRNRVTLIRLKSEKDKRVVSEFSMNIFGGHRSRYYDEVPASKSDVPDTSWLKLTPEAPLEPGEYAVVFLPQDKSLFADSVYDFTVGGDPLPRKK